MRTKDALIQKLKTKADAYLVELEIIKIKMKKLKLITLIAMLTTVFSYSQTSQPLRTNLNGVSGVFIGLPLMDSISLKLIDRNHLKREIKTLGDLALVIEEKRPARAKGRDSRRPRGELGRGFRQRFRSKQAVNQKL